jgi:hypothetical protein
LPPSCAATGICGGGCSSCRPVAAGARAVLDATGVTDRCEGVAGDFFHAVPADADCYVLANVLHDWADTKAAEILATCRNAMTSTAGYESSNA